MSVPLVQSMQRMGGHIGRLAVAAVLLVTACGGRPSAVLGRQVSGCADALRERAAATDAIDAAEKQAVERNRARAAELQGIAAEGKHGVLAAADLAPCEDRAGTRGVAVDLSELRARYRVVVDRIAARLSETAAQPLPVRQAERDDNKGKGKKGD